MLRSSLKNSAGHTRRTNEMQLKKQKGAKAYAKYFIISKIEETALNLQDAIKRAFPVGRLNRKKGKNEHHRKNYQENENRKRRKRSL